MNIGERIKYVRKLRGMKQEELAGKIGLSADENGRTRISQYENGKRTPKEDMLEKISEVLNVKSLYLSNKEHTSALDFVFTLFEYDNDNPITVKKENERYLLDLDNCIFNDFFEEWMQKKTDLNNGKISKEQYIEWKLNYTGKES